ncbi:unnamed protein product [Amaranthus hypochondriacus]
MKPLQISQKIQSFTEVRKEKSLTSLILLLCLISLPVFLLLFNNSTLRFFQPFDQSLVENAQNASTKGDISQVFHIIDGHNKSSNSTITDQQHQPNVLTSSTFDKSSCISRYQYSSYYKSKHYKFHNPSPYLVSKIRNYEKLHTKCGPKSQSYTKLINKLTQSNHINHNQSLPCKYLVWRPVNGLGNRMLSMASSFLYSLLQNRVFLLEFEPEMDNLFCQPFPNSTWVLPKNFPYSSNWSQLPTLKNRENGLIPSFLYLNMQHGEGLGDHNLQHFHCNETLSFLEKIPVLIIISDQYFIPWLFMSPFFKLELNKMFLDKGTVFHHLGHYLFSPSNEVWTLITSYYQAYLAKADEKIGIQIRVFHQPKARVDDIVSQILNCTQSHTILPSFGNTTSGSTSQNTTLKSKVVLVTSLYPEFAEELRSMYLKKPTLNGKVIGVYQPSHEEYQKFQDNMHNMNALAEIYLLSLCDVLVTSPRSTFGYVAQSLGGLKPWIMLRLGSKQHDLGCKRDFSIEPCFHHVPKNECEDKIKINKSTNYNYLYPFVQKCEDVRSGIKFFGS